MATVTLTPLSPSALFTACSQDDVSFDTTAELEPLVS